MPPSDHRLSILPSRSIRPLDLGPDADPTVPPDLELTRPTDPADLPAAGPGFVVAGELGRGAMGVVYRATQPGLNRVVAVKVLLGDAADPRQALRFLAEAEAVAAIDHPHVVRVYEYGQRDGRPFLVMEYLPGGTLAAGLTGRPPERPEAVARLVHKLAQGVAAAHTAGVVHRDLKSANVLFDAAGEPRVTDFGLAKRAGGSDLTKTEAWMGTPAYMSPEQARGEGKFVGPPADVWALGVILYECLTGKRPFAAKDTWALWRQVIGAEPAAVRSVSPDVPRDLALIAHKCLSKEPGERYPTARELAEDLRRYLAGEPILARPVPAAVRAWKWAKRNRAVAASLAGAVVALVSGTGVSVAFALRARSAAEQADAEKVVAQASESQSRRLLGRLAVTEGVRRAGLGDGYQALAWFAEPRRVAPELRAEDLAGDRIFAYRRYGRLPIVTELGPSGGARRSGEREVRIDYHAEREVWTVRVWDADTGRPISPPITHDEAINAAAFSPDGRHLVTASDDRTARVWDIVTGAPVSPPLRHGDWVLSVAFGPDGRVVTGCRDRTARVWDAATGTPLTPPLAHLDWVKAVAFSPDGRRLATGSKDRSVRVWDAGTGLPLTPPLAHEGTVVSVTFSPDGRRLVSASDDRTARVWDAATGLALTPPLTHPGPVRSAAFGPDGRQLTTISEDGVARLWDTAGPPATSRLPHDRLIRFAAFSPDGCRVATASVDKTARVWDPATGSPVAPPVLHTDEVNTVAFSPDGRRLATTSDDWTARVWDVSTGRDITPPLPHKERVRVARFSPNGQRLVTGSRDRTARVWDTDTGRDVVPPLKHDDWVLSVVFSPDGRRVATGCKDGTARVWDIATGLPVTPPLDHAGGVLSVSFSPDGRSLLTGSDDGTARVWDAVTGLPVTPPLAHAGVGVWAEFSPDGRRAASWGEDGTARVWNPATGAPVTPPLAHAGWVLSLAFSPDGRRVATGGKDRSARVWDAATGQPLTPPLAHSDWVKWVAFSPDGRCLMTATPDGTARVWELSADDRPSDDLVKLAQLTAGGRIDDTGAFTALTADETQTLFTELKAKYPADFTVTPAQALAWHREQLDDAERDKDWFAVAFQLRVLLRDYAFADVELILKLRDAEAKLKPREVLPPPR